MLDLLIRGLAIWRISYMLVNEFGPGRAFRKLRELSGIEYADDNIINYNDYTPLICTMCTSVYIGFVSLVLPRWILNALAGSAVSVIIDLVLEDGSK